MELKDDLKRVHAKSQKNRGSNGPEISFFSKITKKVPENQFLQNANPADPSSNLKRSNACVFFFSPALPTLLPHRHLTPLLAVTPPPLVYKYHLISHQKGQSSKDQAQCIFIFLLSKNPQNIFQGSPYLWVLPPRCFSLFLSETHPNPNPAQIQQTKGFFH